VVERVLRDQVSSDFSVIWVDTEQEYERIVRFANRFQPALVKRVKLYTKETPLYDQFGLNEEINKALKSKVWLKSGGYIVINQTEALVAIDVNTGKYVGKTARLEDTIVKTNVDAIKEIVRQVRLRDLGGIIIIDFIDMEEPEHRRQVIQALERALSDDHVKTNISSVSPLGLVEMTRKRTRESLEHLLCQPCPTCEGRGFVKTAETVCYEVFREIVRQSRQFECQQLMVLAHQDVIERLLDEESSALGELELVTGKPIRLQTEALYTVDQYDVVLM